jgi:hypothetical protein
MKANIAEIRTDKVAHVIYEPYSTSKIDFNTGQSFSGWVVHVTLSNRNSFREFYGQESSAEKRGTFFLDAFDQGQLRTEIFPDTLDQVNW